MALGRKGQQQSRPILPIAAWKALTDDHKRAGAAVAFSPVDKAVRKDAGEDGPISFIASTPGQDRYGDVILAEGWDLTRYKQNPVLLFAHNWWGVPIGKAPGMNVANGMLMSGPVEFCGADVNELGPQCEAAVRQGFLNAVSVGFNPIEWSFTDDGVLFKACELLELSVVPIPANADALVQSKGAAEHWLKAWAERNFLDEKLTPATRALAQDLAVVFRGKASDDNEGTRLVEAMTRIADGLAAQLEGQRELKAMLEPIVRFAAKLEAKEMGDQLADAAQKFLKK
jgi:HK97 family phage prohead protease